jgi:alkanesulfonate monooxygenase SsuD/methylene tetrahydromethanopterin reductase-like flavin-dependent oxidoreductase (luciferase family)
MHDIKGLEELGVVAVGIASSEFADAAAAQNRSLGYDPAVVFVPHPIQDRTDAEMRALADQAFEAILKSCRGGPP